MTLPGDEGCGQSPTPVTLTRRDGSVDDGVVTLLPEAEKPPVPLAMHHMPICVTFAFFDGGDVFVIDPSVKEELVRGGKSGNGWREWR